MNTKSMKNLALMQLALLSGGLNGNPKGEDTSKEVVIYPNSFYDANKSVDEANQKRYRKAMKKGFNGSYEEFISKINEKELVSESS